MFPSGGVSISIEAASPAVMTHSTIRWDMLNPWVTAPGRSKTASAIDPASGVSTVIATSYPAAVGAAEMVLPLPQIAGTITRLVRDHSKEPRT